MQPAPKLRLSDLVAHNATYFADKVAVRIDENAVTHRELARLVEDARAVLGPHVRAGDRVGLWLHNSFAWIASFVALSSLGAVSVPISTRLTPQELWVILRDAQAHTLVATSSYRRRNYVDEVVSSHAAGHPSLTVLDASDTRPASDWPVIALGRERFERLASAGEDVLCIQYTSGTTATPKGVVLTNAAYLQTANYVARCQRLTPESRFISGAPFFHCSGTMHAITVSFLAGCALNAMTAWDPQRFLDMTERYACDVAHMIYFRDVLALGDARARQKLRSLSCAHDLGTREFLMQIQDELGVSGISNIYGMTETAGQFTMWCPDDPFESRVSGNGRPQIGNRIRVAAPDRDEALPPGEQGEIQMRGSTLTPGYFNRPQATAEATTSDGWLRSGDLGAINERGELRYIARLKEIIRVGGENMAPAEVEQALRDLTGVQQVCVVGVDDARLDEVPVAVLVGAGEIDWSGALAQLRGKLASFKLPRAIYYAESFPLTPTNRVQRATLKKWIEEDRLRKVADMRTRPTG